MKSGHNLTENLLSFRQSNGGFYHVLDASDGNNQMSSEQDSMPSSPSTAPKTAKRPLPHG
ncbi:MAG: hypothetical protein ACLUFI_07225 [Oscillospiraceae bacterium]